MSTVFAFAPAPGHTIEHHPEHAGRAQAIWRLLADEGALADLDSITPPAATVDQVARAHSPQHIEQVRRASLLGDGRLDADTYITAATYDAALLAAGSCCMAVDRIFSDQAANGLAVVRPPGHHAKFGRAAGFCLFNNAAVAARQAQAVHGARRVLIVDFDVHHGDGTQDIFYEDDSVLFVSSHLYGHFFYPGSGAAHEIGRGAGRGYNMNIPLPAQVGDKGYQQLFEALIAPKAAAFQPDLVIVSAGFDAHWADPLASGGLTLVGYAAICRQLLALAATLCHGRILFVLEGGYLLDALAYGVLNLVHALRGRDRIQDPLGPMPHPETPIAPLLAQLRELHLLK